MTNYAQPPAQNELAGLDGETRLWNSLMDWRSSKSAILFVVSLALFTDMCIYGVVIPLLPDLAPKDGWSRNVFFASYAGSLLFFTPLFGWVSDATKNRKVPLLIGQLGMALSTSLFIFGSTYSAYLMGRILQGVSAAATWVVGLAILSETYGSDQMGQAVGVASSANMLGFLVGPLIGGAMKEAFGGIRAPFIACALLAIIDLLVRLMIKEPVGRTSPNVRLFSDAESRCHSITQVAIDTVHGILLPHGGWSLIMVLVIGAASLSLLEASMAAILKAKFFLSSLQISFVLMVLIVPGMLCAYIVGRFSTRHRRRKMIAIGLLLHGIALPLLAMSSNIYQFVLGVAYFSLTVSLMLTPIIPELAYLAERSQTFNYAKLYAVYNFCYTAGMLIGPVIGGLIGKYYDSLLPVSFLFCILVYVLALQLWNTYMNR